MVLVFKISDGYVKDHVTVPPAFPISQAGGLYHPLKAWNINLSTVIKDHSHHLRPAYPLPLSLLWNTPHSLQNRRQSFKKKFACAVCEARMSPAEDCLCGVSKPSVWHRSQVSQPSPEFWSRRRPKLVRKASLKPFARGMEPTQNWKPLCLHGYAIRPISDEWSVDRW